MESIDVHASRESADDCEPGDVRQRIRDEYEAINAPYEHFARVAVLRDFLTENVVDLTRIHTVYYVFQDSYNRAKQLPLGGGDGPYEPPAAFAQLAPDIATGLAWDGSAGRLSVPLVIWVREPFVVPTTAYRPHRFRLDVWENGAYQYTGADETAQFSGSVR